MLCEEADNSRHSQYCLLHESLTTGPAKGKAKGKDGKEEVKGKAKQRAAVKAKDKPKKKPTKKKKVSSKCHSTLRLQYGGFARHLLTALHSNRFLATQN